MSIGERRLALVEAVDEGVVLIPWSFTANGANPTVITGAEVSSVAGVKLVTRVSAGLFTFTLTDKPSAVLAAPANVSGGATEDITAQVDVSTATTTGVITVRTKTGATATDPTAGDVVSGIIVATKTDRKVGL